MDEQKPATAARMYDYFLGGIHNFPADQEAAKNVIAQFPFIPAGARANRGFLGRAVRYMAESGVRQFLDLGSGIPTQGNVHEIAQSIAPQARVVYVDIDPVAVAESLELLDGNDGATAIRADVLNPSSVLDHPQVRELLHPGEPTGLLMAAVLHFVPDDGQAHDVVARLRGALAPGSYLLVSHAAVEAFPDSDAKIDQVGDVYRRKTTSAGVLRTRAEVTGFLAGTELVDPGVVWLSEWRPDPDTPAEFTDPARSCAWAGVGRIPG